MRDNQPVTQRAFEFPDDATLMSTTDAQSHITYANDAFVSVRGYTREEIQGQQHNLVRHPDIGWRALDGSGQEPTQEWRPLLGSRQRHSGGAPGTAGRVHVSSHQGLP